MKVIIINLFAETLVLFSSTHTVNSTWKDRSSLWSTFLSLLPLLELVSKHIKWESLIVLSIRIFLTSIITKVLSLLLVLNVVRYFLCIVKLLRWTYMLTLTFVVLLYLVRNTLQSCQLTSFLLLSQALYSLFV